MQIIEELKKILDNHECNCYEIDEENYKLTYIGENKGCDTLHPAVAELTGFLLKNGIHYDMDEKNNIKLNLIDNIKLNDSMSQLHKMKL